MLDELNHIQSVSAWLSGVRLTPAASSFSYLDDRLRHRGTGIHRHPQSLQ
ncbi:hypothetical protein [Saccharothrix sp. ALI-22-I]|nr:hypothetical protein [Saccharothrix sp. ALI-22-I]